MEYDEVRLLQHRLVELRARDLVPDTVLFLEHKPVITRGRGLQLAGSTRVRHMPLPERLPRDIRFSESERGGDLTYHGPGQLVVYPICKLGGSNLINRDVTAFIRMLERIVISLVDGFGIHAEAAREGASGVWVGTRKIASIGIAVKKWVTYHGIAINCVNDMEPFSLISPCGFSPETMVRLSDLLSDGSTLWDEFARDWRGAVEKRLSVLMAGWGS
ncbi:MAG: lipoyl(octanoyl) transferase LipB [Bdellovibrionota bacterium]